MTPLRYAGMSAQEDAVLAIQRETAAEFRTTTRQLRSRRSQTRVVSRPRQIAMHLARKLTGLSWHQLAWLFNRDHSSVLTACRRAAELLAGDPELQAAADRIEAKVAEGAA